MPRASRKATESRNEILKAALELVREYGAPALTLDAVADRAGFSKGGLLYNFPSKDALIIGMVEFLADTFETEIEAARQRHVHSCSPTLCAMIDVTEGWLSQQRDVARALLPATTAKPELIQPFIDVQGRLRGAIEAETQMSGTAWIIWTSLDGLHFSEAHNVSILSDAERSLVFSELRRLLNELEN